MGATKISTIITTLVTFSIFTTSTSLDTILPSQPINNNQTLISATGTFELGFFSPGTSSDLYIGIWFNKNPRQFVWVANRQSPITTTTGVLHLTSGNLAISASTETLNTLTWSTNTSTATSAQLLDTGNLVVYANETVLWQSFDYPTHALLPEMKLGRDLATNHQWALSSWKSDSDPAPGGFTYTVYTGNRRPPEAYIMNGTTPIWRSGPWDGDGWSGLPAMTTNAFFDYNFTNNPQEVYYSYEVKNQSTASVVLLEQNGVIQRMVWIGTSWNNYWKLTPDQCDTYGFCGSFSVCHNSGAPTVNCNCLRGFEPQSELDWGLREWSGGCKRKLDVGCGKGDGFVNVTQLKLPDTANATSDSGKTIDECRDWCLANCSCLAYAMTSVEGGGCINWYGEELMDLRDFSGGGGGNDLYLRLAASELDAVGVSTEKSSHSKKSTGAIIAVPIVLAVIIISIAICIFLVKRRKGNTIPRQSKSQSASANLFATEEFDAYDLSNDVTKDHELPTIAFTVIASSTNNFSYETKIGEGGFGPVHKGTLPNGQQIAVKRLSKGSVQGVDEFKNEIKLIANLQHKNLVRLLGCSIKDDERLLVYEYMANRSLDKFLFDPIKSIQLDWKIRIGVIHGIAQGLLYLHKYSRLRIIHRDLKCSNILLDNDMNPKISDFGIARIFGGNQDHANTRRVVGTYGYMPPEYAIKGLFSEKSDVFSYGVLLLEVVSGKKNGDFDQVGALLGRAWELWKNGRVTELMDPVLGQSCSLQELTRCVHVGLLCVQEEAAERPTMSSVISFLSSDSTVLPSPTNVAFITSKGMNQYTSSGEGYSNSNDITITAVEPRFKISGINYNMKVYTKFVLSVEYSVMILTTAHLFKFQCQHSFMICLVLLLCLKALWVWSPQNNYILSQILLRKQVNLPIWLTNGIW